VANLQRKHKGARSELVASAWLLNQGYEVFRNVSQHGLIDIIAVKDGKTLFLDVKSAGCNANVLLSTEQVAAGVLGLIVYVRLFPANQE
jgi:Holliday junction resolvase-like predicted endonuclease